MHDEPRKSSRSTSTAFAASIRLTWICRLSLRKSAENASLAWMPPTRAAASIDDVGTGLVQEIEDRVAVTQVELGRRGPDEVVKPSRLEVPPDGRSRQTAVSGDVDAVSLARGRVARGISAVVHTLEPGRSSNASPTAIEEQHMSDPKVLVVLPTLGDRLDTLRETLGSVDSQREDVCVDTRRRRSPTRPCRTRDGRVDGCSGRRRPERGHLGGNQPRPRRTDDPRRTTPGSATTISSARAGCVAFATCCARPEGRARLRRLRLHRSGGAHDRHEQRGGSLAVFLLPWGPDLIPHPGTMVRLDDLLAIGGFDPRAQVRMDLDAFLKLRRHGRFHPHPDAGVGVPVAPRFAHGRQSSRVESGVRVGEASPPARGAAADQPAVAVSDQLGVVVRGPSCERFGSRSLTRAPRVLG